jgi:hypothetical protein
LSYGRNNSADVPESGRQARLFDDGPPFQYISAHLPGTIAGSATNVKSNQA